jgi:hypothetical protein
VFSKGGKLMYRHKDAPVIQWDIRIAVEDVLDEWHQEFSEAYDRIIVAIIDQKLIVQGTDDEEQTYGAFCTALVQLQEYEADWVLQHEWGDLYSLIRVEE